jgi:hypothetical protein
MIGESIESLCLVFARSERNGGVGYKDCECQNNYPCHKSNILMRHVP